MRVGLALAVVPGVPAQAPPQTARELADALQKKYDLVREFSADFVHIYQGGAIRKQITERGTVEIKKPGKMRWNYMEPEQKLFVSDGTRMFFYIPKDRQVMVKSVPTADVATTPALFLAGKGNILRDFTVSLTNVAGAPPGSRALKLEPTMPDREYTWLTLVLDPSLRITMLLTVDAQGGQSTFQFSNNKENPGQPDNDIVFTVPRGVQVIGDARP